MSSHLLHSRPRLLSGSRTRPPEHRSSPRPARLTPRWWTEVGLVLAIYVAYDATRGLQHTRINTADHNGQLLFRWEHELGLSPEHALNQALHHLPALAVLAAYYYATMHFIVTPAVLVWLYRSHPRRYRQARTWLATATVTALLGFWLFPVTPPRMLPRSGIRDTIADVHQWGWWSGHTSAPRGMGSLVNEFAAMPSLHVGWALWAGWLIARHAQRHWLRGLGVIYPFATTIVVLSTGNHYLADAVVGAALIALAGAATSIRGSGTWLGLLIVRRSVTPARLSAARSRRGGVDGGVEPGTRRGAVSELSRPMIAAGDAEPRQPGRAVRYIQQLPSTTNQPRTGRR